MAAAGTSQNPSEPMLSAMLLRFDFHGLVRLLHPDVVLPGDLGSDRPPLVIRGAHDVVKYARPPRCAQVHAARVAGHAGAVVTVEGQPFSVLAFTVVGGRIVEIDGIADSDRVARIAAGVLGEG